MSDTTVIAGSGELRITSAQTVAAVREQRALTAAAVASQRPKIVTASAMKLQSSKDSTNRRRSKAWQTRAHEYVHQIPELNYASRFYSRMLRRIRIYPALRTPDDKSTPIEEGLPVELLDQIQDAGGGRSALLAAYGRLMFIAGEGYLFGRNLGKDEERWSFVSMDEIEEVGEGKLKWKPTESSNGQEFSSQQAVAYRMWTPDAQYSEEADSPMRAVLEIASELLILTKAVNQTAVSRMTQGMIKVPSELSFGSEEPEDGDEDPEINPFLRDLFEHIQGVVENAGSAEAAAPFVAEAAYEYLDKLEWIRLHDPANDYMEQSLRKEAVERMALGLDMPPEVLLGLADSNHWTGRQITHDMWRSHGAGVAEQFCDDLAEAYLRPALKKEKFENWREVVVAYDDSDVVVSPDRSDDADRAFDRLALSWDGYRKLKGVPDGMDPSEDEMKLLLAFKLRSPEMLEGTPFALPERGPLPEADEPRDAEEGPPDPGNREVSRPEARNSAIYGNAEAALQRCRELAGSRIRSYMQGNEHLRQRFLELVDGQPNAQIASLIGAEALAEIGCPVPLDLCHQGADGFRSLLEHKGFSKTQAEALAEMVKVFAARTLCEATAPELPSGFAAQVERMKEVSDALGHQ